MGHNYYDPDLQHQDAEYLDDSQVQCPSHTTQRKLIAKIDLRVIPVLSVLYLLAFLDRTNIANAAVFGLQKDLKLTGTQYNSALTIFFVPYIVFEIPSNILLKRLKPHVWLSGCMFLFGFVTVMQGLVHNWSGLLATRFFLGLAESVRHSSERSSYTSKHLRWDKRDFGEQEAIEVVNCHDGDDFFTV